MSKQRPGQIGDYWLSQNRHGTWCRTFFDPQTRQTRRIGLGAETFEDAVKSLARWYVLNETLEREQPQDLQLAVALDRYEERHGKNVASSHAVKRSAALAREF